MNRRRWRVVAFLTGLSIVAAGCTRAPAGGTANAGGSAASSPPDREHRQAQAVLDRWADAVAATGGPPWFSVAQELETGLVGAWENVEIGGNGKVAIGAGAVIANPALPDTVPPPADVRWADGVTKSVPLISARAALARLQSIGQGQCGTCHPLIVTSAKLSTSGMTTSRGQAVVPVWEFAVQGTAVRITQLAVSPTASAKAEPLNKSGLRTLESASGIRESRSLKVEFEGNQTTGDKPCGADYTGEVVESELGVVVIIHELPRATPAPFAPPVFCAGPGGFRSMTFELAAPLGDRAVLDLTSGLPVPVTLAD